MEVLDRLEPLARRGPQPSVSWAARVGLVAHGVLYVVVGLLALEVARRGGGEEADASGAVEAVAARPYGWTLVLLLAIGLAALVVWRTTQALRGDPVAGSSLRDRLVYATKAVAYASVCAASVKVLLGGGSGSGEEEARSLTARALALPYGQLGVGAVGVVLVLVGLRCARNHAWRADFCSLVDRSRVGEKGLALVRRVGQVGYAGRAVVFVLLGAFVIEAAVTFDPNEARGMSGALHELAARPWGGPVLWFVAAGLVFDGLLSLALARYRRLR